MIRAKRLCNFLLPTSQKTEKVKTRFSNTNDRGLEIDFSAFSLANKLKPLLQEMAHGKFSEVLERSADPESGLANSRKILALGTKAGRQFKLH